MQRCEKTKRAPGVFVDSREKVTKVAKSHNNACNNDDDDDESDDLRPSDEVKKKKKKNNRIGERNAAWVCCGDQTG